VKIAVRPEFFERYDYAAIPIANITRYTHGTDEDRYVVTFTRHRDFSRMYVGHARSEP